MRMLLIILYSLLALPSLSQERVATGLLSIEGDSTQQVEVGNQLELKLVMQVLTSLEELKLQLEESKNKIPPFHIVDIKGSFPEYKLKAIYEVPFKSQGKEVLVKFGKQQIIFLGSERLDNKALGTKNKFYIFDKSNKEVERKTNYFVFAYIILGILILFFFVKIVLFRFRKYKVQQAKEKWFETLNKSYSRQDYEALYKSKPQWEIYFKDSNVETFCNILNKHQYKEKWTQDDHVSMTDAIEKLRRESL